MQNSSSVSHTFPLSSDTNRRSSFSSEAESVLSQVQSTLRFQIEHETCFGQTIYICGNIEDLGQWEPTKGIPLHTNEETYPIWTSTYEVTCPVGKTINYKYYIASGSHNECIEWEKLPNGAPHRSITIKRQGEYIVLNKKGSMDFKYRKVDMEDECSERDEQCEHPHHALSSRKFSFDSSSSAIISSMTPLDLIAYENNKINDDFASESLDFALSQLQNPLCEKIIMATEYLPVTVVRSGDTYEIVVNEESAVFAILNEMMRVKVTERSQFVWVGMLRNYFDFTASEIAVVEEFLAERNYFIINPRRTDWENFMIYKQEILIPLFTDCLFDESNVYLNDFEDYFRSFHVVNIEYAAVIARNNHEGGLIIINDITLSLVPNSIIPNHKQSCIGIYLHMPLPASDIIKLVPHYQDIIHSILLCDVIGFHQYTAARNFMTILKRFFGIFFEITKQGIILLNYLGRNILIHIKHGQTDLEFLQEKAKTQRFIAYKEEYINKLMPPSNKLSDLFMVISLDHTLLIHNIGIKFRAIDLLCERYPQVVNNVSFVFLIKCFEGSKQPFEQTAFIEKEVKRIREKYKRENIIHYEIVQRFELEKRLALFSIANIFLYPLNLEGHCIYANEFISMQTAGKNYYLYLSENTTENLSFKQIVKSNPYNPKVISETIKKCYDGKCFNSSGYEHDMELLSEASTRKWVNEFLMDMRKVKFHSSANKVGVGIGLDYKLMSVNSKFKYLKSDYIKKHYSRSEHRLIFLDYENTLKEIDETFEDYAYANTKQLHSNIAPDSRLLEILKRLSHDERNLIFIMSKHDTETLSTFFKPIKTVGLCCENGFFYKYPEDDAFKQITAINDWSWHDSVVSVLKAFSEKTEGSYINEKKSCVSWVYKHCDGSFGDIQADEIKTHLTSIFGNKIDVVHDTNNNCVDIKIKNANKAAFVAKILTKELKKNDVDFIFVVGDDNTDEEIFKYFKSAEKYFTNFTKKIKVITSVIGYKPSTAKYYFSDVNDCLETLEKLTKCNAATPQKCGRLIKGGMFGSKETSAFFHDIDEGSS